jgi:hypothetical protein
MSEEKAKPKFGAGHANAMARLGLAELRAAVVFSESNVVQPSPYGIYGTKTPGEVQNERGGSSRDAGDAPPRRYSKAEVSSTRRHQGKDKIESHSNRSESNESVEETCSYWTP